MAGLTADGLIIKTYPEIFGEIIAAQRSRVSARMESEPDSLNGNYTGIVSDQLAALWELLEDVYNARWPNFASGFSLSQLVQLTLTNRRAATYSQVPAEAELEPGSYPAGSLVAMVEGRATSRFANVEAVTNGTAGSVAYTLTFKAESTGPITAPAGTLVIAEPVTGWNSITSAVDATPGADIEKDQPLRVRRDLELASGSSTADAIRARVLREVSDFGLLSCRVLFNDYDAADVNGVPGHAFEVIAYGPASPSSEDNARLVAAIRGVKCDGIQAYGSAFSTVTDSQGNETNIGYTRATEVPIYVRLDLSVGPNYAGDAAVEEAILALGTAFAPDTDVSFFKVACTPLAILGVLDVTGGAIGTAPTPTLQDAIVIGIRQIAKFDSSRIVINS